MSTPHTAAECLLDAFRRHGRINETPRNHPGDVDIFEAVAGDAAAVLCIDSESRIYSAYELQQMLDDLHWSLSLLQHRCPGPATLAP